MLNRRLYARSSFFQNTLLFGISYWKIIAGTFQNCRKTRLRCDSGDMVLSRYTTSIHLVSITLPLASRFVTIADRHYRHFSAPHFSFQETAPYSIRWANVGLVVPTSQRDYFRAAGFFFFSRLQTLHHWQRGAVNGCSGSIFGDIYGGNISRINAW